MASRERKRSRSFISLHGRAASPVPAPLVALPRYNNPLQCAESNVKPSLESRRRRPCLEALRLQCRREYLHRSTSSWSPAWFPNEYLEILFSVQVPLSTLRWSPDGSVRRAGAACERHRQSREVCRELCHPLRRWYPPPERNHSAGRGTQLRLFREPYVRRNLGEARL